MPYLDGKKTFSSLIVCREHICVLVQTKDPARPLLCL